MASREEETPRTMAGASWLGLESPLSSRVAAFRNGSSCKFTTRRAFIYMMEILAAVIAVAALQDNTAGRMEKGYGKDPWAMASHHQWYPVIHYVRSALNISDPISRHDLALAKQEGWRELQVNTEPLLQAIKKFASNPKAEVASLLDELISSSQSTPSGLVGLRGVVERAHPTDQTGLASTNQQKTGKKKG